MKPPPTRAARFGGAASRTQAPPTSLPDALIRLAEAEDTLRAIGAGEVDAFLQSDGEGGQRVFTLTTADSTTPFSLSTR